MITLAEQFRKAKLASVPLTAIRTNDPASTIATLATNGAAVIVWDRIRGIFGFNENGKRVVDETFKEHAPESLTNMTDALLAISALPANTIAFFINGHIPFRDNLNPSHHEVVQALWNLRDLFKQDHRMACILAPDFTAPPELAQDMIIFDEPLPDPAQLAAIVLATYEAAAVKKPKDLELVKMIDAISGLPIFIAETVCAMTIGERGIDIESLRERKRQQLEATNGLKVYRGKERASDVKGAANVLSFLEEIMGDTSCIVFMDEIEKMFAGIGNDQDSITKEVLGDYLTWCEKTDEHGNLLMLAILLLGPAGTGKSLIAKAIGNQYDRPTIMMNISGMKDSLVGETQQRFSQATKVIDAVAANKPKLVIATCNKIDVLPPEVRSRFVATFYVDLPEAETRAQLWKQYIAKFKLTDKPLAEDAGWTGREIRNCCMMAARMNCTIQKASSYIVPVSKSAAEQINELRRSASGRYLSASTSGLYRAPDLVQPDAFPQTSRRSIAKAN